MIVDGQPFPWPTAGEPVVRQLLPDFFEVTATFYARHVDGVDVKKLRSCV
jgi:hypothetical protein